jgi:hypothetical protein
LRHAKQESASNIASGVTASRQARKFKQYPFWCHCVTPSNKVQAISLLESLRHAKQESSCNIPSDLYSEKGASSIIVWIINYV